jgi:filamentous hemagglutinin family protein
MSGPKVCIARGGARSRLLRSSALIPAAAVMVGASSSVFAQAVNLGHAGGNSIVPDGRTNTKLAVHGSVTDIRTSTFSGGNAYNSFSTFSEAAGNTVNLHVPHSANKLVNIVRNGAVNIQGTLNSYKNGKIGGNVVFADSYGFVVGKSGSINVGSLTVVTPSGATLDQVVDANGHVDQALATRLIAGNVPLSADGSVVIEGRVNAKHFVKITAQDVRVAGSMEEAKRVAMHRAQFESTVNTQGLTEGGSIVVRNGGISIVAGNNAAIGGKLRANGTASHAGSIAIAAKHNVSIAASAKLSATATRVAKHTVPGLAPSAPTIRISAGDTATIAGALSAQTTGAGLPGQIGITGTDISVTATARLVAQGVGVVDGGHISVKSTDLTTVAAGASFVASALGTGNGGFVDISGKIDRVDAGVTVDLGAVTGKAGTLLFDPYDLYITGPGQNGADLGGSGTTADPTVGGAASTLTSFYTKGANIELDATNSITINGTIDTRQYASELATTPPKSDRARRYLARGWQDKCRILRS